MPALVSANHSSAKMVSISMATTVPVLKTMTFAEPIRSGTETWTLVLTNGTLTGVKTVTLSTLTPISVSVDASHSLKYVKLTLLKQGSTLTLPHANASASPLYHQFVELDYTSTLQAVRVS
jgi:hypothetical protein